MSFMSFPLLFPFAIYIFSEPPIGNMNFYFFSILQVQLFES